jgi:cystathionine beta-lyase/cystathionine gamma-synthase
LKYPHILLLVAIEALSLKIQLFHYSIHPDHHYFRCTNVNNEGTPVSFDIKADRNDITEILLKVALNTITPTPCGIEA